MNLYKLTLVGWVLACCVGCEPDAPTPVTASATTRPSPNEPSASAPQHQGVAEPDESHHVDISSQLGAVIPWQVTLGVSTIEDLVEQARHAQIVHDVSGLSEDQALLIVPTPTHDDVAELAFEGRVADDGRHPVTAVFLDGRDSGDLCERYRTVYFDDQGWPRFDCDVPPLHGDNTWRACGGGQGLGPRISVMCRKIPAEGQPGTMEIFLLPARNEP